MKLSKKDLELIDDAMLYYFIHLNGLMDDIREFDQRLSKERKA